MGGDSDNKNLILAVVLSMAVLFGWQLFFMPPPPQPETETTATESQAGAVPAAPEAAGGTTTTATVSGGSGTQDNGEAAADSPRVKIATPSVTGSIALTGGRLDDLHLSRYPETLDPDAGTVVLLQPASDAQPYFIDYGWRRTVDSDPVPLPGAATSWTVESGGTLTPTTPVVLRWDNGQGLVFRRKFEIDDRYMFTVGQSVENNTGVQVALAPYGAIARRGEPKGTGYYILHEGAVSSFDGELDETSYEDIRDLTVDRDERGPAKKTTVAENGWLGFTDKYWMTTLIPQPGQAFEAVYRMPTVGGVEEFRTEARLPVMTVAPGATVESVTRLFAGAKELDTIGGYEESLGIDKFYDSIDWGWFYFLTKPIAWLLNKVKGVIGNMGFSIIVLTLLVKTCLFPLAYKSFVSMSKMKKLQPEMEKIKERVGDDKQKLQQEMMALYKKEKVNPASGCLPIMLQIPIFFSLYKVLFVTIEMRHAPFVGWIHDLSAPDPTSLFNLFGLLPYDLPAFLVPFSIGVYPIVMGITMWMQQKLNPTPADPTQKMIFAWMPWVFMFMLGRFASGLVIYWCANNILTFSQQYIIMRSQGIEVDLLGNITSGLKRKPAAAKKPADEAANAKPKPADPAKPEATAGEGDGEAGGGDAGGTPAPRIPRGSGAKPRRRRS